LHKILMKDELHYSDVRQTQLTKLWTAFSCSRRALSWVCSSLSVCRDASLL